MWDKLRDFPSSLKIGAILVVIAALALISLQMYQTLVRGSELRKSRELVVHTFQVITTAQKLDRAIQDAERGQRGYLLTNERRYLTPYEEAIGQIPALEDQLRRLTSDNLEHQRQLLILQHHIDTKLAERAKGRTIHNTYMTVPLIFLMISNHFPTATYGASYNWLILSALVLAGGVSAKFIYRA